MKLHDLRAQFGMNLTQFARHIGVSPGQLHDWENGRKRLTLERAAAIERKLDVSGLVAAVVEERTRAA